MRILMFGRGVIATIYGQAFERAGHDVSFAVRPSRLAEYRTGIRLDLIDARRAPLGRRSRTTFSPRLQDVSAVDGPFDLVILSVGHHRLRDAAATLAPLVGDATVLVFGNVWEEPDSAVVPLPADQVLFGFPGAGGGHVDGALQGALFRSVTIGTAPCAAPRQRVVFEAFERAGFVVKQEDDIRGWLWIHFASDAGMFAQALRSGGLVKMIGDRVALRDAFRTSRELLPVLEARGVDLHRHRGATLPLRRPGVAAAASAWATALLPIAQMSLAAHTDPHAQEARRVLIDALATARRLDIPTPRLQRSVDAIR